jgi:hypothetical protein
MKVVMSEKSKSKRLCSEIQLFDLCDREGCEQKDGRYCCDSEMLAKFEAINEEDDSRQDQFLAIESDDVEDYDEDDYENGYFDDLADSYEDEDENE